MDMSDAPSNTGYRVGQNRRVVAADDNMVQNRTDMG